MKIILTLKGKAKLREGVKVAFENLEQTKKVENEVCKQIQVIEDYDTDERTTTILMSVMGAYDLADVHLRRNEDWVPCISG